MFSCEINNNFIWIIYSLRDIIKFNLCTSQWLLWNINVYITFLFVCKHYIYFLKRASSFEIIVWIYSNLFCKINDSRVVTKNSSYYMPSRVFQIINSIFNLAAIIIYMIISFRLKNFPWNKTRCWLTLKIQYKFCAFNIFYYAKFRMRIEWTLFTVIWAFDFG